MIDLDETLYSSSWQPSHVYHSCTDNPEISIAALAALRRTFSSLARRCPAMTDNLRGGVIFAIQHRHLVPRDRSTRD